MIRNVLRMSTLGVASLLVSATALAQMPPPAMPPPPPAPIGTDAVAVPVMPPQPVAVAPMAILPKSPDDMSGSIGFGVGVKSGTQLITTTDVVGIKYWSSDTLAIAPSLNFSYSKPKNVDAAWLFQPEFVLLFVPFKTTSTRFEIGGGLGFSISKNQPVPLPAIPSSDTTFDVYIPIQAGVEHFFTRWFSMGIAARTSFFDFMKEGEASRFSLTINSTAFMGQLFFYTD